MDRPKGGACTKEDEGVLGLLGGAGVGAGVNYTRDQMRHLARVYGPVDDAGLREHACGPLKPGDDGGYALLKAGTTRNLCRHAEHDGLRILGALLPYLHPVEDPVKLVIRLLSEAGYDTGCNSEWAFDENEDDE